MGPTWDIRREGRAWSGDEMRARYDLTPEKFQVYEGRVFRSDQDRLNVLAMLLENVGVYPAFGPRTAGSRPLPSGP